MFFSDFEYIRGHFNEFWSILIFFTHFQIFWKLKYFLRNYIFSTIYVYYERSKELQGVNIFQAIPKNSLEYPWSSMEFPSWNLRNTWSCLWRPWQTSTAFQGLPGRIIDHICNSCVSTCVMGPITECPLGCLTQVSPG